MSPARCSSDIRDAAAQALGTAVAELDADDLLRLVQYAARLVYAAQASRDGTVLIAGPHELQ